MYCQEPLFPCQVDSTREKCGSWASSASAQPSESIRSRSQSGPKHAADISSSTPCHASLSAVSGRRLRPCQPQLPFGIDRGGRGRLNLRRGRLIDLGSGFGCLLRLRGSGLGSRCPLRRLRAHRGPRNRFELRRCRSGGRQRGRRFLGLGGPRRLRQGRPALPSEGVPDPRPDPPGRPRQAVGPASLQLFEPSAEPLALPLDVVAPGGHPVSFGHRTIQLGGQFVPLGLDLGRLLSHALDRPLELLLAFASAFQLGIGGRFPLLLGQGPLQCVPLGLEAVDLVSDSVERFLQLALFLPGGSEHLLSLLDRGVVALSLLRCRSLEGVALGLQPVDLCFGSRDLSSRSRSCSRVWSSCSRSFAC